MKRRYGVFHGLLLSLFSPAYYRDVARHWGGIGFVYLLLMLFVTWVPILVHWQTRLNGKIRNDFPEAVKDFPKITIQNGKVSSPAQQPFIVKGPDGKRGTYVLMGDGSVRWLKEGTDPKLFKAMVTRAGGETMEDFDKAAPKQANKKQPEPAPAPVAP